MKTFFSPPNKVTKDIIPLPPLRPSNSLPKSPGDQVIYIRLLHHVLTVVVVVEAVKQLLKVNYFEGLESHAR